MATLRDPVKPEPVAKYEAFVEEKLAQARSRIRMLDLGAGLLGFLAGTMMFALIVGWLDRWFQFSAGVRQLALVVYGLTALIYLGVVIIWPMIRRLNPYYAARQVEQVLPAAKNSVINWLDLRHETMPNAIRGAVSHRAAKDIAQANLEEAISDRRTMSLGVITLVLFLITVAFMFFGPGLSRIFQPFGAAATTEIRIIKPEGGNGSVAEGRAVSIEAEVLGRQSEALRFLYRHHRTDPYEERPMERGDSSHDWVITVPAFEVHNGFWYKVVGSEAETDEYHINVRSAPAFTEFEVTYHPRPYLRLPDETIKTHQPDLKGIRGTEVQIVAHTNRRVRIGDSGLIISGQQETIKAEPVARDPQAMCFFLVLDKDGTYGIQFTSEERERNNPIFYNITVLPDNVPEVRLTKPEEDPIKLPVNGVLSVEGSATDDHGLTGFTLRMQVISKDRPPEPLQSQRYRPGQSLRMADGSDPLALDYADVVELDKLRQINNEKLRPGMVIEYWLEATDNCDFPGPNVGRSKSKFLTIEAPEPDLEKLQQQKAEAQKEKEKRQAEQDQKLKDQNQPNPEEAQKEEKAPAEPKPAEEKPAEPKPVEEKPAEPKPAEEKQVGQEESAAEPQPAEEKKFQEIEKKLQEQLEKQAREKNPDGSNSDGQKDQDKDKGDKSPKGDPKNEKKNSQSQPKPGDNQGNDDNQQPQKPDPQQKGKEGQPNKDEAKGEKDGQPQAKKKQEKADDSGQQQKKENNKGPGGGSNPADKNQKGDEPGQANSKSPPKPGTNPKAPPKDGRTDQPGQENPADPQAKKSSAEKGERGDKKGTEKGNSPKDNAPGREKGTDQDKSNDSKPGDKPGNEMAKKIGDLLKKAKEGDTQARKQLEQISKEAENPADRQAAKEACKECDQASKSGDQGSKPGDQGSKPGDKPGGDQGNKRGSNDKGQPSDPDKNQSPKPGDKKPGDGGKPGDGSSNAKNEKKTGDSGQGKGEKGESKGAKGDKDSQSAGKIGNNSGGTPQGPREIGSSDGSGPEAAKAAEANPEFQKRAGELQLEDYRKKITKEMLQKANITQKEYDQFLEAYKKKLEREAAEKNKPDKLPDPTRQGGQYSNRRSRQAQSTGNKEDKLPQAGRAEAPPGFGEAYKEFTEETAKSRTSPERKK